MRCRGLGRKRRIFREICVAGEEIFRGIGFVARDANWGTPALSAAPCCDDADGRTRIESAGELTTTTGDLTWSVIRSVVDRVIEARVEATSREGFPTNRTGFVVLHSLGASRGQRVRVTHPDGAVAAAEFPQLVSGNSPSLRSLRWSMRLAPGIDCGCPSRSFRDRLPAQLDRRVLQDILSAASSSHLSDRARRKSRSTLAP